jgi:hypothetical protein
MNAQTEERLIVHFGPCECHAVSTTHVHHRDIPELHAEGSTVAEAGIALQKLLLRELDSAVSVFHRDKVEQALAEVNAYLSDLE